jgi:hypothetical protein
VTPKQLLAEFEGRGDVDKTFGRLAADTPAIKQAEARVDPHDVRKADDGRDRGDIANKIEVELLV